MFSTSWMSDFARILYSNVSNYYGETTCISKESAIKPFYTVDRVDPAFVLFIYQLGKIMLN